MKFKSLITEKNKKKSCTDKLKKESNFKESIKLGGNEYNIYKFAGSKIYAGKNGILGDGGNHIAWHEVNLLSKKFGKSK